MAVLYRRISVISEIRILTKMKKGDQDEKRKNETDSSEKREVGIMNAFYNDTGCGYGLNTVDADTLMNRPLPKEKFVVEGLLPQGVNLLCGSAKIGKSWLVLDLALKVALGEPFWDMATAKCDVLYLCLEDTYSRIQARLMKLTDEAPENLRFAITASALSNGLEEEIIHHLYSYPDTGLIIIDTLQKVRHQSPGSGMYANDYEDITALKRLATEHGISFLLVHHLRKQADSDIFNRVSGSAGLVGAADSTFVLQKAMRGMETGRLFATGRDIEYQEIILRYSNYRWVLQEKKTGEQLKPEVIPPFLFRLREYLVLKREWSGTSSELLKELGESETDPAAAAKAIVRYYYEILYPVGIEMEQKRTNKARLLMFRVRDTSDGGDGKSER